MNNMVNFKQAIRELLALVGFGPQLGAPQPLALPAIAGANGNELSVEPIFEEAPIMMKVQNKKATIAEDTMQKSATSPVASQPKPVAGTTVIAAGTAIMGNLVSQGDVEVQGNIKGDLTTTGNIYITGKIVGNVVGESVELIGCGVQGNVTAKGKLLIDNAAVVVGNLTAGDLSMDGKVKGDVDIANGAVFDGNAVLAGNVSASMVTMNRGAKVQGAVRIAQDSEIDALFDEKFDI